MRVFLSLIVIVIVLPCCHSKAQITLIKNGNANAVIYLSKDAEEIDKRAASVLNNYLKKMSGVAVPIMTIPSKSDSMVGIFIGKNSSSAFTNLPELEGDRFVIRTDANNVYLTGGEGKATLYAVYTLLEEFFGCRKYDGGAPMVPRKEHLTLPADIEETFSPAFSYRETFYPSAMDDEFLDWHKLHRFEDLWGLWGHSFFKLVSPDQYFQEHPDYFSFVNGKRQATQLCLSNPAVLNIAITKLSALMEDNPAALYWSIAPMDGQGYCTCDQCSKIDAEEGGPQGSLIRFVNQVAARFPEEIFTTLAYGYTEKAPIETAPASNVYVMLSTINAQRQTTLAKDAKSAAFRTNLQDWKEKTQQLMVWDYTTQFTSYLTPFPMYDIWQPNINYFFENDVKGVFSQGSGYTYGDFAELAAYVQAKLLWNPNADVRKIQEDFADGYYGAASSHVIYYLTALIQARDESSASLEIYGNPVLSRKDYLSADRVDRYSSLLDQAEAAVENDVEKADRISRLRLGLEYVVLQQSRALGAEKGGYLQEGENSRIYEVKPRWRKRVSDFVRSAEKAGVTELAEAGIDARAYGAEWERLFQVPIKKSLATNRRVQLANPPIPDYPANGAATLTDAVLGTSDFSYNWLLFDGLDMVATIDLDKVSTISEVSLNYLEDPRHYIFSPVNMVVAVSEDGRNFKEVGKEDIAQKNRAMDKSTIQTLTMQLRESHQGRFIRVTLSSRKSLPDWFEGSRHRKPVITCDEIMIN